MSSPAGRRSDLPSALDKSRQEILLSLALRNVARQVNNETLPAPGIVEKQRRDVHPHAVACCRAHMKVEVTDLPSPGRLLLHTAAPQAYWSPENAVALQHVLAALADRVRGPIPEELLGRCVPAADFANFADGKSRIGRVLQESEQFLSVVYPRIRSKISLYGSKRRAMDRGLDVLST